MSKTNDSSWNKVIIEHQRNKQKSLINIEEQTKPMQTTNYDQLKACYCVKEIMKHASIRFVS